MSFWKERANERREARQSKDPVRPLDHRRMKRSREKPFCVEMKRNPKKKSWFSWHKEWSSHGNYVRLKDAQQAMANLKRDRLWGEYFHRIVDKRTGEVIEGGQE